MPGVGQMRPAAKILPRTVPVHADVLALGDPVQQFDLVGFFAVLVVGACAIPCPDFGCDGVAGVDDLFHPGLDHAQILGGEGIGPVEIVEPAMLGDRPDGDLRVGPDVLHGARHDMREAVADQFKRGGVVLKRVDGNRGIGGDGPLQIPMRAVDGGRERLFGQAFGDAFGDLRRRGARVVIAFVAIGESQGNLGHQPCLLVSLAPTERPVAGLIWAPFGGRPVCCQPRGPLVCRNCGFRDDRICVPLMFLFVLDCGRRWRTQT